jgi:hypothetical protein
MGKTTLTDIQQAKHTIALAAEDAVRTIAVAASTANSTKGNDHDLLLRVDTKLDLLTTTVNQLQDGTAKRISTLEAEKLNVNDSYPVLYKKGVDDKLADHEVRLGKLETFNTRVALMLSGGIFALGFLITLIVYHIMGNN